MIIGILIGLAMMAWILVGAYIAFMIVLSGIDRPFFPLIFCGPIGWGVIITLILLQLKQK